MIQDSKVQVTKQGSSMGAESNPVGTSGTQCGTRISEFSHQRDEEDEAFFTTTSEGCWRVGGNFPPCRAYWPCPEKASGKETRLAARSLTGAWKRLSAHEMWGGYCVSQLGLTVMKYHRLGSLNSRNLFSQF